MPNSNGPRWALPLPLWKWFAFFLACGVMVFRQPQYFISPRFWAEEGAVYFEYALHNSWYRTLFAHSGEFVHRFRSCRPVTEGSNAGGRIINQVDGMGLWNAAFIGFFLLKKEDG